MPNTLTDDYKYNIGDIVAVTEPGHSIMLYNMLGTIIGRRVSDNGYTCIYNVLFEMANYRHAYCLVEGALKKIN